MVAHHHRLEAVLTPHERVGRVRAPVDQVSNTKEAIASWVEAQLGQRPFEGAEASVNVADDKIAACGIGRDWADPGRSHERLLELPSARARGPSPAVTYWAQSSMTGRRRSIRSVRRYGRAC